MDGTLVFDLETHPSELLYSMEPGVFVRLIGYRWVGGETVLTTDLEEIKEQIRAARWIIGHNIHAFDLKALFGIHSDEPLELTEQGRVYDTWVHAALVNPAPHMYVNRAGKKALADSPAKMRKWFSLDEQAHQLGVPGKTHDLAELAKEFGGFGCIPVDDPRFRDYLRGDIAASEAVAKALLELGPLDSYAVREQRIAARAAIISTNGFRVDVGRAQERVKSLGVRRDEIMSGLQAKYDFPTEGKAPWASNKGKESILSALADRGITPSSVGDWPMGKTGPSLSGDVLRRVTKGTDAEDMGNALAELKGQRSLAQLALDSMHPDGFTHPSITLLQRSGRWSTTNPGLTIWTARGEGAVEKEYFIPDNEDEVLIEIDYSNADARFIAAVTGDRKYAERFEPGADGHMINAIAAWGEAEVAKDPKGYRQKAKPLGHGWSYGGRPRTLSKESGVPLAEAEQFVNGMDRQFHVLVRWQNRIRKEAQRGYVVNEWERKLWVEKGREFTQGPALIGQNGTREIVCDALLRMPAHVLRRVKAQIHDALIFSVPRKNWEECKDYLVELMATSFKPARGGQLISFPVDAGTPGDNWYLASH